MNVVVWLVGCCYYYSCHRLCCFGIFFFSSAFVYNKPAKII